MRIWLLAIVFIALLAAASAAEIESAVYDKLQSEDKVRVLVVLEDNHVLKKGLTSQAFEANVQDSLDITAQLTNSNILQTYESFPGFVAEVSAEDLQVLEDMDVQVIADDMRFEIFLDSAMPITNADDVHPLQVDGVNLTGLHETVCIIDNGVNASHPALAGRIIDQYDFFNGDAVAEDTNGHGTHVSGIVTSNDSTYKGIAPEAGVVMMKVGNTSALSLTNITAALAWCIANATALNISVISMSFGETDKGYPSPNGTCPTYLDSSFAAANAAGIMLVAASGNDDLTNGVSYPACNTNVTAVGATNDTDAVASFSNTGHLLDLFAPGVSVTSTDDGGVSFVSLSGTSMSTPMVAGAAAIVNQYRKLKTGSGLTPAQIKSELVASGTNVTDTKNTSITRPRIDVQNALRPNITVQEPLNQTYDTDVHFNVTVEFPVTNVTFSVDGGANNTMENDTPTHWSNTTFGTLASDGHNVTFYVDSEVDNSTTVLFVVDTTAPQIFLNSPANASTINKGDLINFTVNDTESSISTVWYALNNTATNTTISATSGFYLINTSTWVKGENNITVFANDSIGNENSSSGFVFTIANSAPAISSIKPLAGTRVNGTIKVNASITDADSDTITDVWFFFSNNSGSTWFFFNSTTTPISGSTYEVNWNTSATPDGQNHRIRINASDGTVNGTANLTGNFIVNNVNVAPSVTVLEPDEDDIWEDEENIIWNATDPDNDTLTISIYYRENDSDDWHVIDSSEANDGTFTWDTNDVDDGDNYAINVTATDPGGLRDSDVSGEFTIDNGEPTPSGSGAPPTTTTTNQTAEQLAAQEAARQAAAFDAQQSFTTITANTPVTFTPNVASLAVQSVSIETNTNVDAVIAKIKRLTNSTIPAPGVVYQYFQLEAEGLSNAAISEIQINFDVPTTFVEDKGSIYLALLNGTEWERLATSRTNTTNTTISYRGTTDHLTVFAITSTPPLAIGTGGGAIAGIIIIGLFFAALLYMIFGNQIKGGKPAEKKPKRESPEFKGWQPAAFKEKPRIRKGAPDFGFNNS